MASTRVVFITSAFLLLTGIRHASGLDASGKAVPFDFLNAESELYYNLTQKYNKHIRPVQSASDTINVKIGISLIQILNFDESKQKLHALAWIEKTWTDEALRWNPEHFHGIDVLRVPNEVIWKPDILLYNSIAGTWKYKYSSYAVVYSTGTIVFIPPIHLKSACHVDLTNFPFDEQTCNWTLGSWTYDGHKVDINFLNDRPGIDLSNYRESSEWSVTDHSAKKNVKYYSCCKEPYPELTVTLRLRRRMGSYRHTLVAPSIILSLLIPVVFLLPTGSTE